MSRLIIIWSRKPAVRQAAALGLSRSGFTVTVVETATEVRAVHDTSEAPTILLIGPEISDQDLEYVPHGEGGPPVLLIEDLLEPLSSATIDQLAPAERLLVPLRLRGLIEAVERAGAKREPPAS